MLAEAVDWRPTTPPRDVDILMATPELSHYVSGWPRPRDVGVIALDPEPIGAAWWRFFTVDDPGYGFVDEATPELSIGVLDAARGMGVGTRLLEVLIEEARRRSIGALSLSVEPENPALELYRRLGFQVVGGVGGSYTMVRSTSL
jgi:GNAT superfamily N-acetyltransferase